MARYKDGGKATVESCRSIDVLEWQRLGYLRSPGWISCARTRGGERVASINLQAQRHAVTLKYQRRSYGEDWSDVEQHVAIAWTPCRFGGERPGLCVQLQQMERIAVAQSSSCTSPDDYSPVATAISSLM